MAKKSGKELEYALQLQELGIYSPAFDGEIHQLCILERELSRARKEWKATAEPPAKTPSFTHELYGVITQIQREILARRDALGLTPKALRRLRGQAAPNSGADVPGTGSGNPQLTQLLNQLKEDAGGQA